MFHNTRNEVMERSYAVLTTSFRYVKSLPATRRSPMDAVRARLGRPQAGGTDVIRILLAEDMALIRGAFAALIDREPDLHVVAEADDGDEMLAAAIGCRPDVAIIDIDRPAFDLAHAAQLREGLPSCRTLILTSLGRPGVMHGVLAAAVSGF